jgi:hypothetical protein
MSPARTWVIGDVHGCLTELDELLRLIGWKAGGQDALLFLGDLLDRGPESVGCVRRVREIGARCLLGNHEDKHLRYREHARRASWDRSYLNPMRPLCGKAAEAHAGLSDDDWQWLHGLPVTVALQGGYRAVHGGFPGDCAPERARPSDLIRTRYVDAAGKPKPLGKDLNAVPEGCTFWTTHWKGPESVLYGHHVHGLDGPHVEFPAPGVRTIGLDAGCCFGGHLLAYCPEEDSFAGVRARQNYARKGVEEGAEGCNQAVTVPV